MVAPKMYVAAFHILWHEMVKLLCEMQTSVVDVIYFLLWKLGLKSLSWKTKESFKVSLQTVSVKFIPCFCALLWTFLCRIIKILCKWFLSMPFKVENHNLLIPFFLPKSSFTNTHAKVCKVCLSPLEAFLQMSCYFYMCHISSFQSLCMF